MDKYYKFLHHFDREEYQKVVPESDQEKSKPMPSFQKDYSPNAALIDLIPPNEITIGNRPFFKILNDRVSRRKYTEYPLSFEELSYLLWCTQGVKKKKGFGLMRTVPSAGARNPFEIYLIINRVEGIAPGLYRYISLTHKLLFIKTIDNSESRINELTYGMGFVGKGAVIFCLVAIPYRMEWRYTIIAPKFIAIEVGLVFENLYLACEAADLGTVAIGYYEQDKMDKLLELNGKDEFLVLIAPIGKVPKRDTITEDLFKMIENELD